MLSGLAIPVIVWIGTACDNVAWGGIHVRIDQPPPAPGAPPDEGEAPAAEEEETGEEPLPEGPVVYAVRGAGDTVTIVPVGERDDGGIRPLFPGADAAVFAARFAEAAYGPDRELALFAGGARVGSVTPDGPLELLDSAYCPPRPTTTGVVELVRGAAGVERFVAVAEGAARGIPRGGYDPPEMRRTYYFAAYDLASTEVRERRVPWPPDWIAARADLRPIRVRGDGPPAFAATYLYRDALRVGPAPDDGYALFLLAEEGEGGFEAGFVWFREHGPETKLAPRLLDHVDLDGDGIQELVLEFLGARSRSFGVVAHRADGWELVHRDRCPEGDAEAVAAGAPGG